MYNWAWRCTPLMPELGRQSGQEDQHKFKASLVSHNDPASGWGFSSAIEHLPSKCREVLGLVLSLGVRDDTQNSKTDQKIK